MCQGAEGLVEIVITQVVWSCYLSGILVKLESESLWARNRCKYKKDKKSVRLSAVRFLEPHLHLHCELAECNVAKQPLYSKIHMRASVTIGRSNTLTCFCPTAAPP